MSKKTPYIDTGKKTKILGDDLNHTLRPICAKGKALNPKYTLAAHDEHIDHLFHNINECVRRVKATGEKPSVVKMRKEVRGCIKHEYPKGSFLHLVT